MYWCLAIPLSAVILLLYSTWPFAWLVRKNERRISKVKDSWNDAHEGVGVWPGNRYDISCNSGLCLVTELRGKLVACMHEVPSLYQLRTAREWRGDNQIRVWWSWFYLIRAVMHSSLSPERLPIFPPYSHLFFYEFSWASRWLLSWLLALRGTSFRKKKEKTKENCKKYVIFASCLGCWQARQLRRCILNPRLILLSSWRAIVTTEPEARTTFDCKWRGQQRRMRLRSRVSVLEQKNQLVAAR